MSADAPVGSLFILPWKCNHLLLSDRCEKYLFTFWTLGKVIQKFGGFFFRTPTELGWILAQHAWYLGSSWMIPTTVGSAGVQQLLPLLKLRWHPSYERTSIPYHFSFIPKPYSLQATFDTTCTPHFGHRVPWFCLQPPGWVFSATCIIVRVALTLSLIVTEVVYQPVVLVWENGKNI